MANVRMILRLYMVNLEVMATPKCVGKIFESFFDFTFSQNILALHSKKTLKIPIF